MGADRTSFDQIGAILNRQVSPTLRGPEKRTNPLNFFNEVTDEQLKTYTVLEIRTILEQRGNVISALQQLAKKGRGPPVPAKPWILSVREACCNTYCHDCRPRYEKRSYLSLNGIVNGEIPATAAAGYGFHGMRTRPVVNAAVWKNIGLLPVPLPRGHPARPRPPENADSPQFPVKPYLWWQSSDELHASEIWYQTLECDGFSDEIRTPNTPPPTPTLWTGIYEAENGVTVFDDSSLFVYDGRSDSSITTNIFSRDQVMHSITGHRQWGELCREEDILPMVLDEPEDPIT